MTNVERGDETRTGRLGEPSESNLLVEETSGSSSKERHADCTVCEESGTYAK